MKVRFKSATCEEGRIAYEVKDATRGVFEFDEITNKYEEVYEVAILGKVPIRLLEETDDENDVDALNVYLRLKPKTLS